MMEIGWNHLTFNEKWPIIAFANKITAPLSSTHTLPESIGFKEEQQNENLIPNTLISILLKAESKHMF